jgi:putative colanic acid biosynthesis acetyltransferase WcaF
MDDAVSRSMLAKTPLLRRELSRRNKVQRAVWQATWSVLFRISPRPVFAWRRLLLRTFGARLGDDSVIHASVRVWAPWNLEMGHGSCLGPNVDCYSVDRVVIGDCVTVSQSAFLCTASRDINEPAMPLVTAPIWLGNQSWICAGAFIGPGVAVGEGAVVGARAVVVRNVQPWTVVGGNPARVIGARHRQALVP